MLTAGWIKVFCISHNILGELIRESIQLPIDMRNVEPYKIVEEQFDPTAPMFQNINLEGGST